MKIVKMALLAISLISVGTVTPTPNLIDILDGAATVGLVAGPVFLVIGNFSIDFLTYIDAVSKKKTSIGPIIGGPLFSMSSATKAAISYFKQLEIQNKILETQEKSLETHNEIIKALKENNGTNQATLSTNQKILEQLELNRLTKLAQESSNQ